MAGTKLEGVAVPKDATAETRPDLFGTRGQLRPDGDGGITSMMLADKPEYATPGDSKIDNGFYVGTRGLPWHVGLARTLGERELMTDAGRLLTVEEALAATESFEVGTVPIRTETGIVIPNKVATVRLDTGAPLGIVTPRWKPFQERELAEFAVLLVDSGEAGFETGGHMFDGAYFFLSMELDHLGIQVPGDPSDVKTYLLLRTAHDGTAATSFHITHVRTVCRNTERLAMRGAVTTWKIRHTGSLEGKVEQVRSALGIAFKNQELVKALTTKLGTTKLVDAQVREIFAKVWPVEAKTGEAEAERLSRTADRAYEDYMTSETLEGIRGTAWGAYNAVTESLDHLATYKTEDSRAWSLLDGSGAEAKDRALKLLVAASKTK